MARRAVGQQLQALYADKLIHGRPVRITQADSVAALGPQPPDLLFIALPTVAERQAAIAYAHRAHILTVSDAKGFAEQGGIIQMTRVAGARIQPPPPLHCGWH